jgi:hypothetical protein
MHRCVQVSVVRVPQGLVQLRIVKHLPEPIYDLPISRRLIRDHSLDRSQCKRDKRVAAALQCRSYRLRSDQLAEPHHGRGVSKGLRRGLVFDHNMGHRMKLWICELHPGSAMIVHDPLDPFDFIELEPSFRMGLFVCFVAHGKCSCGQPPLKSLM